ncbi:MAG: GGDEF domain-containing protein [Spirochaetia bacterium]
MKSDLKVLSENVKAMNKIAIPANVRHILMSAITVVYFLLLFFASTEVQRIIVMLITPISLTFISLYNMKKGLVFAVFLLAANLVALSFLRSPADVFFSPYLYMGGCLHLFISALFANMLRLNENLKEEIAHRKRTEEKLKKISYTDGLTGLYNRRIGFSILEKQMKMSEREANPMVLCFIDVDDLKKVNDGFGHAMGDLLISTIAEAIRKNIRESDTVFRFGGDEFIIILPNATERSAAIVVERILHSLRIQDHPFGFPMQFSAGLTQYDAKKHTDLEKLVNAADNAMYRTKEAQKSNTSIDAVKL